MQEDTLDAGEKIADGESQPAVVSFATVGNLRKVLTNRRIELLQCLIDIDGAAESITAVANELERDYRTVHDDVSLLTDHGLLFIIDEGQSKRLYVPYERIHLDVELAGLSAGENSALA
jgi:Predicted transcriptional regulator